MFDIWFWSRVSVGDECWVWSGPPSPKGYGKYRWDNEQQAHRVAYRMMVGSIPEGMTLDHLCLNTLCVRPSHLEPVTFAENTRRQRALFDEANYPRCSNDHEYTVENTYRTPRGHRACRTCMRAASARYAMKRG